MMTLTLEIPAELVRQLARASKRERLSHSQWACRALVACIARQDQPAGFVSALDRAGDLVGCFSGGPADLSCNVKHMKAFGKT
jgi:hypothetical protein